MLNHAAFEEHEQSFMDNTPGDWCEKVGVGAVDTPEYLKIICDSLAGHLDNIFTIAAVDKEGGQICGYVRRMLDDEHITPES